MEWSRRLIRQSVIITELEYRLNELDALPRNSCVHSIA